jgi:hypothetical protein
MMKRLVMQTISVTATLGAVAACGEIDSEIAPGGAKGGGLTAPSVPDGGRVTTGTDAGPSPRDAAVTTEAGPNDGPSDASTFVTDGGTEGGTSILSPGAPTLFAGICVTSLAAGDPEQAIRFYTVLDRSTPGGMTVSLTPMVGWNTATNTPVAPSRVSLSETRGETVTQRVTLQSLDRFTVDLGTLNLVAEANSISGRNAVIEDVRFEGIYRGTADTCTTLSGELTSPYSFVLASDRNTCLFVPVADGDPFPTRARAAFTCAP